MNGKGESHGHISKGQVWLVLGLIVLVFALATVQRFVLQTPQFAAVISAVLVDLANQDRAQASLGTLRVNPVLVAAAQAKANDMAAKGYFAHVAPDGKDSWYWFQQQGYDFLHAGENLAVDFNDSVDVEHAWMNSPTHRANLLNGHFTEIGIAVAQGIYQGRSTVFVVQMFGTPAPVHAATAEPIVIVENTPVNAEDPALATTAPDTTVSEEITGAPQVLGSAQEAQEPGSPTAAVATIAQASPWEHLLASPKQTMRYAYYLLAFLVVLILVARTGVEIRRHHHDHVIVVLSLLAVMLIAFFVADMVMFSDPVLAAVF